MQVAGSMQLRTQRCLIMRGHCPFIHASLVTGGSGRHGERVRSEEHTSELQSLMRISYAVFCLKKKKITHTAQSELDTIHIATSPTRRVVHTADRTITRYHVPHQ